MGSSLYLFMFMHLFFLLSCFHNIILTNSASSKQALCLDSERSALLQFKQSLSHDEHASVQPSAYSKVASWRLQGGKSECCSWDGVQCDEDTGHVIGLDLSSSFLYGSINSSSSLFSLVHLERLNLTDNFFNYSQIPSNISHLSRLSSLDLSNSQFFGQIPLEILGLSKLVSLNLGSNVDSSSQESFLKLETPSLTNLVQNLTNLKELSLSYVNISSGVPDILANLSSLTSLSLEGCALYGAFPADIFHLPKLQVLNIQINEYLTGYFPDFHHSSPLKDLLLASTSFSGTLPDSIGYLNSLNQLDLSDCHFSGPLPARLGNLTQLKTLILDSNNYTGQISSLASLPQLVFLSLVDNQFTGQIPFCLANLTRLTYLDLTYNHLQGSIPSTLAKLQKLEYFSVYSNNLNGTVEADIFLSIKTLTSLHLSYNEISFLSTPAVNATLPKLTHLGLSSCNLKDFPHFLQFQDKLETLFLDYNNIQGPMPEWMWNRSKETSRETFHFDNFTTGFDHHPVLPWASLQHLDLSNNMLRGLLPIPPENTIVYEVSNNRLSGKVPQLICYINSLYILDLSNNDMSGTIPPCLGNLTNSLLVLNLKGNNFQGAIPPTYSEGCKLNMIDLSQNQLEGQVPRSWSNCTSLQILDLADNQIEDTFPFWLGTLSDLQVLILRSNKFHGAINSPIPSLDFPMLRIIDLSKNGFIGDLPLEYIENWNEMKFVHAGKLEYMQGSITIPEEGFDWSYPYVYSITMTNKGLELMYTAIPSILIAIDLSSNKLKGEIPKSIGNLKGLESLNLSNNDLIGCIPSSIGNLTELESLDLSQNKLSGEIPQQLAQLSFLALLNVSYNRLSGPIPQGRQFNTFQNNSYEGNSALCGDPLSMKCGNSEVSSPPPPLTIGESDDSDYPSGVDWIVIFVGFGSGLVVGFLIGHHLTTRHHEWFVHKFGKRQDKTISRQKRRGRRN